ncbi:hypothetical protein [Streptococcus anginosus]|uniref:hypothetical protein n=1 Tax=Streptococcus anginosus TaxID=1328 RepID=UPI002000F8D1|nr:hypothetical protein [Streptococcus anginosus]
MAVVDGSLFAVKKGNFIQKLENPLSKDYTITYTNTYIKSMYAYSELRILGGLGCLKFKI